jgi:hypothetical protein
MSKARTATSAPLDPGEEKEREASARRDYGIDHLDEGEELIDDATFTDMQATFEGAQREADGGAPAPAEPDEVEELLLEEITGERRSGGERRAASGQDDSDSAPPGSPAEVVALEAEIQAAADRDDVVRLALRLARAHARVAALLVVHQGMIVGLRAQGEGTQDRIEGIVIPADAESVFAAPVSRGKAHRGEPPSRGIDVRLLRALGRSEARDLVVIPISIRDRVVNLLYADNGNDFLGETSVAALCALARCMARAYERLILERKKG